MRIAAVLIVLGVVSRIAPHPPNAVAMGALSLYAGARLPRRWAFAVPLAAMLLSDLLIDLFVYPQFARGFFGAVRLASYATFVAIALAGSLARVAGPPARIGMSLGASTLFFLTTNFAVWATDQQLFTRDLAGLIACYDFALPFFGNTAAADLIGTAALFGTEALLRHGRAAKPAAADLD